MRIGRRTLTSAHLVVIGSIVALFLGALVFARRPHGVGHDPEDHLQGSSRYPSPSGGKALYTLFRNLGMPAVRHERRVEILDRDARVLMVLGAPGPFTEEEAAWARRWVHEGNTIVWCPRAGEGGGALAEKFGVKLVSCDAGPTEVSATLQPISSSSRRDYRLSVAAPSRLEGPSDAVALASDGGGAVVLMVRRGEGRFIALADRRLFSNAGLPDADNAVFLVHLAALSAGESSIAFDEFHHGFAEGQSAFALVWDSPLRGALILGILACFCAVFATGRRLGPPVSLRQERRRRPSEFMDAFAGLSRRMRAAPQVMGLVLAEFQMFLRRHQGAAEPEAIERLAVRGGMRPGRAMEIFDHASHAADERAFAASCRELEELRDAVRRASQRTCPEQAANAASRRRP